VVSNSSSRSARAAALAQPLEPELAFLVACVRALWDESAAREIRNYTAAPLDWDRFLDQVTHHRITSLVFQTLQTQDGCVPPTVMERLSGAARSAAILTMRQIAETARLTSILAQAGIGALVLKGPVLSVVAFGDPFRRDSRDIDLIVEAEAIERADAVLRADGYERIKPEASMPPGQLARYRRWVHEFSYYSPSRRIIVEVKGRIDPMMSVPMVDLTEHMRRPRIVDVGGVELRTMPDVDHFLYLCAHGSRHSWFRLKWIADIAAMLRHKSFDFDAVRTRAMELDLERCLHTALLLARELLQAPVPETLFAQVRADPGARRLQAAARKCLTRSGRDADPSKSFGFTLQLFLGEYNMRSDWGYRRTVLQRHALSYAYPLLRPAIRMAEKLRTSAACR
jgi:hypothetical protein